VKSLNNFFKKSPWEVLGGYYFIWIGSFLTFGVDCQTTYQCQWTLCLDYTGTWATRQDTSRPRTCPFPHQEMYLALEFTLWMWANPSSPTNATCKMDVVCGV
jgi:hypothetical protein